MQGLHKFLRVREIIKRRLGSQDGWVLIDAIASSLVVVLAFVGTTMAFDGSNRSVQRDQTKNQAMIVAQNEIESMRALAQADIAQVTCDWNATSAPTCYDGKPTTVVYRGITYNVAHRAYYVAGIDGNAIDACGTAYSANSSAARYIYMKATVTYAGQIAGSTAGYNATPTMLDSYYAPEGGAGQANTGTLRVYVLNRNNAISTTATTINLYQGSTSNGVYATGAVNPSTGCVLFTGLPRATYYISANVTSGLQDLYLSNSGSNVITQKVVMPYRGALSRVMRIDSPNTVTTTFHVLGGTGGTTDTPVVTGTGNASALVGPWVAMNDEIVSDPTTDFATGPGRTYMPHTGSTAITNKLFPLAGGYSAYAGPCNLNNPDDSTIAGTEWQPVPTAAELSTSVWAPGASYATSLWLSQMRARFYAGGPGKPTSGLAQNTKYYWGQALASGKVAVNLTGDLANSSVYVSCGSRASLYNSWIRLPGTISLSTGKLTSDSAMALPTGTYDVCIKATVTAQTQTTNGNTTVGWSGSPATETYTVYKIMTGQLLRFKGNASPYFDLSSTTADVGSTSTCSGADWT